MLYVKVNVVQMHGGHLYIFAVGLSNTLSAGMPHDPGVVL